MGIKKYWKSLDHIEKFIWISWATIATLTFLIDGMADLLAWIPFLAAAFIYNLI